MIECITGLPGVGKTLTASKWALKKMKQGKKVYANYPLEGAELVDDIFPLLGNVSNALIVVDEASVVFDQLFMSKVPKRVWTELRQHRHDGVDLLLTAQDLRDIAYPMRRLIQFHWDVHFKFWRFVSVTCKVPRVGGDTYGKRLWYISPKIYESYDTHYKVEVDTLTDVKKEQKKKYNKYLSMQDELLNETFEYIC